MKDNKVVVLTSKGKDSNISAAFSSSKSINIDFFGLSGDCDSFGPLPGTSAKEFLRLDV